MNTSFLVMGTPLFLATRSQFSALDEHSSARFNLLRAEIAGMREQAASFREQADRRFEQFDKRFDWMHSEMVAMERRIEQRLPRWPGDGDAPGSAALLHDHPGGSLARPAGRVDGEGWRGVPARHGPAGQDRQAGAAHAPTWEELQTLLEGMQAVLDSFDCDRVRQLLVDAVREYRPSEVLHDLVWARRLAGEQRASASPSRHLRAVPPP